VLRDVRNFNCRSALSTTHAARTRHAT
jgi:hypothetical protein